MLTGLNWLRISSNYEFLKIVFNIWVLLLEGYLFPPPEIE
jgi:hypothetical protein